MDVSLLWSLASLSACFLHFSYYGMYHSSFFRSAMKSIKSWWVRPCVSQLYPRTKQSSQTIGQCFLDKHKPEPLVQRADNVACKSSIKLFSHLPGIKAVYTWTTSGIANSVYLWKPSWRKLNKSHNRALCSVFSMKVCILLLIYGLCS